MRHTVSDPRAWRLSTVFYCGKFLPGRPHGAGRPRGGRVYRAVAAVIAVAAGGGVRPGRDRAGGTGGQGTGEEPAVGGGQTRRLRDPARPGAGARGDAAPLDGRAVHPAGAGPVRRGAPHAGTNLRFLGRQVVPQLYPQDMPLPRERAKAPYSPAEIAGYLALADAQPTPARRARAAGLVCLGAGAGLIRSDLRNVRGTDICCRSHGGIVTVRRGPCGCWPPTTRRCWKPPRLPATASSPAAPSPGAAISPTR